MINNNLPITEQSSIRGAGAYSKEAETSVLGGILIKPTEAEVMLRKVEKYISNPNEFYKTSHKLIWDAIRKLSKNGDPIDQVTVTQQLINSGKIEHAGGAYYVTGLIEDTVSNANIEYHALIVKENYIKRRLNTLSNELKAISGKEYKTAISEAEKLAKELQSLKIMSSEDSHSVAKIVDKTTEKMEKGGSVIPFRLPYLDHAANGVTRGGIAVLGGRPGHGKTTLGTAIAMAQAETDLKVLMLNRQIPNDEIIKKIIVNLSGVVPYKKIRQGKYKYKINGEKVLNFTKEEMESIEEATLYMKENYKNLIMMDDVRTLDETIQVIKNIGPDFVIDDYLQLIKIGDLKKDRRLQLEDIMTEYEWQAKPSNCNFAAVAISQLSRELEKRMDQRPRISDLAEAGSIEQIAESVIFVYYGHNLDSTVYPANMVEVIFGKTRYGNLESFKIGYNGDKCRYYISPNEANKDM